MAHDGPLGGRQLPATLPQGLVTICAGLQFPEGPVHMSDGSILLVEIADGSVSRVRPDGSKTTVARTGGGPNGLAVGPDGMLYVCNNGGFSWERQDGQLFPARVLLDADYSGGRIERIDPQSASIEIIYEGSGSGRLNGPNDIVFDGDGGFWFTDLGKYRGRVMDRGAVYYATADGRRIEEAIFPALTPNGIGLSPDGSSLYVAESQSARLWRFAIQAPGQIKRLSTSTPHGGEVVYTAPGYQVFDSLAIEANGNICIGTLVSGGITVVSPDGVLVDFVKLPDSSPTNLCFGGAHHRNAFVTLSQTGRLVKLDWPRPGLPANFSL
jgi:gluconolactonase